MGRGVEHQARLRMGKALAFALMAVAPSMLIALDGQAPEGKVAVGPASSAPTGSALSAPAGPLSLTPATPRAGNSPGFHKVETDSRGDGFVDDVVYLNAKGQKVREELDFNRDGRMDDFLSYEDGLLVREEIDSHFNGKIDIRVYLYRGVYIERYERDTNGDGVFDVVKDYSRKK